MKKVNLIIALVVVMVFTGCTTQIARLKQNPQEYLGKIVALSGSVTKSVKIPLTGFFVFLYEDSSNGPIAVFSTKEHKEGESFVLKGKVIAFPEEGTNQAAADATAYITDLLVNHNFAKRKTAETIAVGALKVIKTVSKGLGSVFFLVEEE
jgi:hypothetical protein